MKIDPRNGPVETDYGIKSTIVQVVLCVVGNTALLSSGMTLGFTAVALPYMLEPNDILYINQDQASWVASLAAISTPIGCLVSGPIIDRFGRKMGLITLNIPAFIGWLCIAVNPNLAQLYVGRLLTGFACGLSSIPATVYTAESSTASLRGLLVTGTSIAISLGVALVYILGLFLGENWKLVAYICSVFPVCSAILIAFLMPESPVWLMTNGHPDKASDSLKILRGFAEISEIQHELDEMSEKAAESRKKKRSLLANLKAMMKPEAYKPFILMNIFFLFQQLTGIFVVIFYAVDVVREAGVTTDPFVVAVLIGLTRLTVTFCAAFMSKRFGRRPTAITSGIGMTISLAALGTHLYLQRTSHVEEAAEFNITNSTNMTRLENAEIPEPSLLPVISILIYILASTVGFLTLPWAMIGEVYPAQVRGVASGMTTCITYLVSFVAVKLYPKMIQILDKHGVFYFYGSMALLGTVFVIVYLPETQGRTLAQIEAYFAGKKKRKPELFDEEEALHAKEMVIIQPAAKQ